MSARTPGPWRADIGQDGRWHVWEAQRLLRIASNVEPAWHAEGNARLIAGAPDLLEALRALYGWVRDGAYAPFSPLAQVHGAGPTEEQIARAEAIDAQVKAAIGRATGERQP